MPLKPRPTGLGHGVYKDNVDYGVFCGEWCIGRIYETRTGPADLRWFWALHAPGGRETLRASNRVATLRDRQGRVRGELEAVEGVGGDGRGAVKSIVIVVSFAVILTASWWLLGSTVPGIMVFIVGAAVWLWRWIGRRGRPA